MLLLLLLLLLLLFPLPHIIHQSTTRQDIWPFLCKSLCLSEGSHFKAIHCLLQVPSRTCDSVYARQVLGRVEEVDHRTNTVCFTFLVDDVLNMLQKNCISFLIGIKDIYLFIWDLYIYAICLHYTSLYYLFV